MISISMRVCAIAIASIATTFASTCPTVKNEGDPVGEIKDVKGIQTYLSNPLGPTYDASTAILYVSDIYGLPLVQNKLLADSLAKTGYPVVFPDLFRGDAVPVGSPEAGLNLTEWRSRHPPEEIDSIIATTISYMKKELGVKRIGGVGYCFGGKYVPRAMKGSGIDVGFIAHPSSLTEEEIKDIIGPISIAAGQLDAAFNTTARVNAETILAAKNATFQTTLYSAAPHGFAVRANISIPQQKYAKEASFLQAVQWFDAWL